MKSSISILPSRIWRNLLFLTIASAVAATILNTNIETRVKKKIWRRPGKLLMAALLTLPPPEHLPHFPVPQEPQENQLVVEEGRAVMSIFEPPATSSALSNVFETSSGPDLSLNFDDRGCEKRWNIFHYIALYGNREALETLLRRMEEWEIKSNKLINARALMYVNHEGVRFFITPYMLATLNSVEMQEKLTENGAVVETLPVPIPFRFFIP